MRRRGEALQLEHQQGQHHHQHDREQLEDRRRCLCRSPRSRRRSRCDSQPAASALIGASCGRMALVTSAPARRRAMSARTVITQLAVAPPEDRLFEPTARPRDLRQRHRRRRRGRDGEIAEARSRSSRSPARRAPRPRSSSVPSRISVTVQRRKSASAASARCPAARGRAPAPGPGRRRAGSTAPISFQSSVRIAHVGFGAHRRRATWPRSSRTSCGSWPTTRNCTGSRPAGRS